MTTIEQIKAEIERRKNNAETLRERNICIDILYSLDTLEKSETPMNLEGLEEEIERIVKCEKEFMNFKFKSQLIGYIARHFAKWGAEHAREQMMKEAVEIGTTEICWVPDGDRVFPTFDPPVEDLLMPGIISQRFKDGDKVRIIIVREDEK